MGTAQLVKDAAIGTAAGLVASEVMSPVTNKLYEMQTEDSKKKEQAVSYGVAYEVAAKKTAEAAGVSLDEDAAHKAGSALHYALGVSAAPLYMVLRRKTKLTPWGAGIAAGTALYVTVDEVLNPILGFTPPPKAYPLVTHLRGLAGHLVLGLVLAAAVEGGWKLLGGARSGH